MKKKISRRDVTKALGFAGGSLLITPVIAETAVPTPEQTAGPFYPVTPQDDKDVDLTQIDGHANRATGEVILVRGRVFNTRGELLPGATVDVWQANHHGRYSHPDDPNPNPLDPDFQGWGIMQTAGDGAYGYKTIKPGAYAISEDTVRCRHIHYKVSHPDYTEITTQMYFPGDPLLADDIVMNDTPEELRHLLISEESEDADSGLPLYRFDVVLG